VGFACIEQRHAFMERGKWQTVGHDVLNIQAALQQAKHFIPCCKHAAAKNAAPGESFENELA
jgi:hypothetical protein